MMVCNLNLSHKFLKETAARMAGRKGYSISFHSFSQLNHLHIFITASFFRRFDFLHNSVTSAPFHGFTIPCTVFNRLPGGAMNLLGKSAVRHIMNLQISVPVRAGCPCAIPAIMVTSIHVFHPYPLHISVFTTYAFAIIAFTGICPWR